MLPKPSETWLTHDAILLSGLLVVMLAGIIAAVGLLFLQRWAAWLYLFSIALGYCLLPFTGPVVEHGVASVVDDSSTIFTGMILALAFFTDALNSPRVDSEPITAELVK